VLTAVGVNRRDGQLAALAGFECQLFGLHAHGHQFGHAFRSVGRAAENPLQRALVVIRLSGGPAVFVLRLAHHRVDHIAQKQAFLGFDEIDSPAGGFPGQRQVVFLGRRTEHRQVQSAFAGCRAVTRGAVAAQPVKHGHDVGQKIDGFVAGSLGRRPLLGRWRRRRLCGPQPAGNCQRPDRPPNPDRLAAHRRSSPSRFSAHAGRQMADTARRSARPTRQYSTARGIETRLLRPSDAVQVSRGAKGGAHNVRLRLHRAGGHLRAIRRAAHRRCVALSRLVPSTDRPATCETCKWFFRREGPQKEAYPAVPRMIFARRIPTRTRGSIHRRGPHFAARVHTVRYACRLDLRPGRADKLGRHSLHPGIAWPTSRRHICPL